MAWSVVNLLASPLPVFVTRTQLIQWIKIKPSCHGRWRRARRISMHFFCDGNLSSNESWTRTKDGCWYFSDPTDDDLSEVSLCIITRYRLTQVNHRIIFLVSFFELPFYVAFLFDSQRLLPLPLLCFDPQECWTIPTQCGKISGIVYGRRGAEAAAFCDNENGCSVVWSTAQRKSFASPW